MGGTSTDVATIVDGSPRRTTSSVIDSLPVGLPMFDIHTIGAGGGSIAYLDQGGALRVGPQSAGAVPGPACYQRGGMIPTVTDANVVLGRIPTDAMLGGSVALSRKAAEGAIAQLAGAMHKNVIETAIGITRVAESNMAHAVRAVTSRRGLDPRDFALVSFGGAGGLHACAIADELDIPRVVVPPYCGVLSALGMVVAPPVVDVSKTVLHLAAARQLDDDRLAAEYGSLSARSIETVSFEGTSSVEPMADVRFAGQSHELTVPVSRPSVEAIREAFIAEYVKVYGTVRAGREIEIVTLRLRRTGHAARVVLPELPAAPITQTVATIHSSDGSAATAKVVGRAGIAAASLPVHGPALLIDPHATSYLPPGWLGTGRNDGTIVLERENSSRRGQ
jgi:N-methylhydantoinase A